MEKIKVSSGYLTGFFASICEGAEIPENFVNLNLNELQSTKKLITDFLIPETARKSKSWHYHFKETLKYAINYWDNDKLLDIYMGVLPEIYPPSEKYIPMKLFLKIAWESMYPNESYSIDDKAKYIEMPPLGAF